MTWSRFGIVSVVVFLAALACTREIKSPAKISIAIAPSVMKKSDVSTLSLTLTRIMINVTRPGQPTVVYVKDSHELGGGSIPPFVEMDVPSGNDQLIQVLAVYEDDSSSGMSFYYQDTTRTLTSGVNEITMTLQQLGSSSGVEGRIVGRYALPGPTYPTAKLDVVYNPGNGRQPMVVSDGEIVGGWFNLFLLDDIRMTYRFRDTKTPLSFTTDFVAGNRVQSTNVKLSDFSPVTYSAGVFPGIGVVDLSSQTTMFRTHDVSGPGTYEPVNPLKFVYGFHGSSDLPWTGLYVKFYDSVTTNFSKLKSVTKDPADSDCDSVNMNSNVDVLDIATTATTTTGLPCTIYTGPISYTSNLAGGTTNASPLSSWTTDYVEVDRTNLDGNGNDSVAPFKGILRMQSNNPLNFTSTFSGASCSGGCNHPFDLQLVSGVDSIIDVIKIYKSSTMSAEDARGGDYPNCEKLASDPDMTLIGTIDVTSGTSSYTNNNIPIDAADVNTSHPVAICPVDSSGRFLPGAVVLESKQLFY